MAATETRPLPSAVTPAVPADEGAVLKKLSTLDRFLPLWIALAMGVGLALGALVPSLNDGLDRLRVGTVSLPIAAGLLLMMYPVLAKVRYEDLGTMRDDGVNDRRFFGVSLFLSWIVGPLLMFILAWTFLPDQPAYRTGVIIVGLARCIAMVLIWNDIAQGDRDRAAVLVVFNALFQIVAYSLLGYFYLTVLPGWLGLDTQGFDVGIWEVARTVLIFLGIPLTAGYLTRRIGIKRHGRDWYEQRFIPRIAPITLYGLLFTIVLLFAIQGDKITAQPLDVVLIALPLLIYFAVMWVAGFSTGRLLRFPLPADRGSLLHGREQRLRTGDRGRRRCLRCRLRRGACRRRRPADRGPGSGRARLRRALAPPAPAMAAGVRRDLGNRVTSCCPEAAASVADDAEDLGLLGAATTRPTRERKALRHGGNGEDEQHDPDQPHGREKQQPEEGDRGHQRRRPEDRAPLDRPLSGVTHQRHAVGRWAPAGQGRHSPAR